MTKKKYAIHPGYIQSKNDHQRHFIGYYDLIRLYCLNPHDCIVWNDDVPKTWLGRNPDDYIHLGTSYSGNYDSTKNDEGLLGYTKSYMRYGRDQ